MSEPTDRPDFRVEFSLPTAMLIAGVLLVAASFTPLGRWAANSQWTPADSARYDQIGTQLKRSTYRSPDRAGLSESEWESQRANMQQQLDALQLKLDRAKGQPQRWSRYLLGVGVLLTAAGFYASKAGQS